MPRGRQDSAFHAHAGQHRNRRQINSLDCDKPAAGSISRPRAPNLSPPLELQQRDAPSLGVAGIPPNGRLARPTDTKGHTMDAQTLILLAVVVVLAVTLVLELMKPRARPCKAPVCCAEAYLAALKAGTDRIARATEILESTRKQGCAVDRAAYQVTYPQGTTKAETRSKPTTPAKQKQEPAKKRRR